MAFPDAVYPAHIPLSSFLWVVIILPMGSIQPMYIITDIMTTSTVGVNTQRMLKNINDWFWHVLYTGAPCLNTFVASCYEYPAPLTTRVSAPKEGRQQLLLLFLGFVLLLRGELAAEHILVVTTREGRCHWDLCTG